MLPSDSGGGLQYMAQKESGILWFLVGVGIGTVAGILYAPRSGSETREVLRAKADEGREFIRTRASEAREHASEWVDKGREQASEWVDKGREAVNQQKDQI